MGMLAFPQMLKNGYDVRLASGVVCAGGCLGILIPPSIMLIVYGAMASLSVVKLYAAAMVPGFLLAGMYIVYVIGVGIIKPHMAPPLPKGEGDISMGELMLMLAKSFFPLAVLILSVLGIDHVRAGNADRSGRRGRVRRHAARGRLPLR